MGEYFGVPDNPFITGFETVLIFYLSGFVISHLHDMVMAAGRSPNDFR